MKLNMRKYDEEFEINIKINFIEHKNKTQNDIGDVTNCFLKTTFTLK